jgi:hypothetical protein
MFSRLKPLHSMPTKPWQCPLRFTATQTIRHQLAKAIF